MAILDKNLEPAVAYSDIYAQGSVYFSTIHQEPDRSTETPFLRDIKQCLDTLQVDLSMCGLLHEISVETMIARGLSGIFNTDAVFVQRATPMWPEPSDAIETYVATIGAGHHQNQPISSCKIVLRRRYPTPQNPSPSI